MQPPKLVQSIGTEIAIAWPDGSESYYPMEYLRASSPSAENKGEVDILGHRHGGNDQTEFPGVTVMGWQFVGNYAVRFGFSDGHQTGLFSWDYLHEIDPARA